MRTQPDARQPDRLASMKNDSDVTKYVLSLSVEQADSLERIAINRAGLGVEVSGTDIVRGRGSDTSRKKNQIAVG